MEKEKNKFHVTHHTLCQNDKRYEVLQSNLHAEHTRMHKFTEVANEEREKQISCHSLHFVYEW